MENTRKELVLKQMISGGDNPKEAKERVEKFYNNARRLYPDATFRGLAKIIKIYSANN